VTLKIEYPSHLITHGIITAPISNPDTSAKNSVVSRYERTDC
jgi:hypothetical protein